jgi:hypothetical protein
VTTPTSDKNPSNVGEEITLSATVSPAGATGTVAFTEGGTTLGTAPVQPNGVAELKISSLSATQHQIRARYQGDANFAQSALSGTLTQTVNSVNTAPVANDDPSYSTAVDTPLTVNAQDGVLANDTDADSDPLTAIPVSLPANGTLDWHSDGSFTYTPNAGFTGADTWTYKANDGTADSNVATVTITVQ